MKSRRNYRYGMVQKDFSCLKETLIPYESYQSSTDAEPMLMMLPQERPSIFQIWRDLTNLQAWPCIVALRWMPEAECTRTV